MDASGRRRLAVLGSPIGHSRSPDLHRAAYRALGLDWEYGREEVTTDGLAGFLDGLDDSWRGLSLTMPLKRDVLPLLDSRDPLVDLTGAANTVVLSSGRRHGANTDVHGIRAALADHGIHSVDAVQLVGAGATAASALAAVAALGAARVHVSARAPERAASLVALGAELGVDVSAHPIGAGPGDVQLVVSTLPGEAATEVAPLIEPGTAALFDVAYDPWPSPFARRWEGAPGEIVTGLELLLHQAVAQVRLFRHGDADVEVPGEPAVVAAMRAAVGLR